METPAFHSFRQEFARRAEWRREEERRFVNQVREEEQEKKRQREREQEDQVLMDWVLAELASESDIEAFVAKLDARDTATVEALMENEKALERVREELRIMLDKAYVLPDGRRVFKTEDGTRVFDEHGQEVRDFDPAHVEDIRPRWERYRQYRNEQTILTEERRELIDYQHRLDTIREEAGKEDLTKAELDELEKRLEEERPRPSNAT